MADPILAVSGLTKRFGAFFANSGIDLTVLPGEVHAIIGPNGAGKTTFVAQIAGELSPSAGRIVFQGRDISALPPYRRAALGLARTFQITSAFRSFSALENVAIAAQALAGSSFGMWSPADSDHELNRRSRQALELVQLSDRAEEPCMALSHGEHRQLEIAMAFVNQPKLVLLDEPTAGMGPEESQQVLALLRRLKGRQGMILVEHDMEVVFAISDRITVLVNGAAIASGSPAQIRANPAVRAAYLGD
ncbi:MAG TPA: ABC transporter ATP-binding protein [Burkholderiales bacterium]|nr:ABC transporter ATP-binding protein [Burkholderiales bacterium]